MALALRPQKVKVVIEFDETTGRGKMHYLRKGSLIDPAVRVQAKLDDCKLEVSTERELFDVDLGLPYLSRWPGPQRLALKLDAEVRDGGEYELVSKKKKRKRKNRKKRMKR